MVRHARHNVEIGDAPATDHQVIEPHPIGLAVFPMVLDLVLFEIHSTDLLGPAKYPGQKLSKRHNHVQRIDGRSYYFSQQRAEDQVVLPIEQHHLGLFPTQLAAQRLGALGTAKSTANDDYSLFVHNRQLP